MRGSVTAPLRDGSSANALRRLGSNIAAGSSLRSQLRRAAWPIGRRMRWDPSIDRSTSSATILGSGAELVFGVIAGDGLVADDVVREVSDAAAEVGIAPGSPEASEIARRLAEVDLGG